MRVKEMSIDVFRESLSRLLYRRYYLPIYQYKKEYIYLYVCLDKFPT